MKANEPTMDWADIVKRLRESRHESQVELGVALGLSRPSAATSVCRWERGRVVPSHPRRRAILAMMWAQAEKEGAR